MNFFTHSYRHPHQRRGFTTIELLATMSILSVIAVTSARLLTQILKTSQQLRSSQHESIAFDRLARTWRSDVRSATELNTDDIEGQLGRLTDANGCTIVYSFDVFEAESSSRLMRECRQHGDLVERSVFFAPPNTTFDVTRDVEFDQLFVTLTASTLREDAIRPSQVMNVQTALNTLPPRRFEASDAEPQP